MRYSFIYFLFILKILFIIYYLFVFICFYLFLFVFICFYLFLFVSFDLSIYILLQVIVSEGEEAERCVQETKQQCSVRYSPIPPPFFFNYIYLFRVIIL